MILIKRLWATVYSFDRQFLGTETVYDDDASGYTSD